MNDVLKFSLLATLGLGFIWVLVSCISSCNDAESKRFRDEAAAARAYERENCDPYLGRTIMLGGRLYTITGFTFWGRNAVAIGPDGAPTDLEWAVVRNLVGPLPVQVEKR